jgi:urea transporter
MARVTSARRAALAAVDMVLRAHANVLFSRSRVTGALLAAAVATAPGAAALAGVGLAAAALAARMLGLARGSMREGPYGTNALLVSLGVAHAFGASAPAFALAAVAGGATVLATAALTSLAARLGPVPVLSAPFVLVLWIVQSFAATHGAVSLVPLGPSAGVAPPLDAVLSGVGALVFAPRPEAGALVLAALLWHSRIAALLATLAVAVVIPFAPDALLAPVALNAALTAVVLGGVWFIPSPSSFVIALGGASLAAVVTTTLVGPLAQLGVAPLILPFALVSVLVLLAMRQRVADARPKSVDFVPGSPEENLAYYQTRRARFRAIHPVAIHLPFRGAWLCTQAEDGALTHQEQWRHAFDFEGTDGEGRTYRGEGNALDDHHCYRLPVLAAADGVVAKVVSDVPDNAIGALDLERNWGNVVLVYHAPGLYSLVAHLAPGSIRVREGQHVRLGDVLGACGSSGRSPRPHLHFQLQASPQLGAPTVPCRFTDLVTCDDGGDRVSASGVPREGQIVRNLAIDADVAAAFAFAPGGVLALRVDGRVEHVENDVDLLGNRVLRSRERAASLFFARADDGFTAYDVLGSAASSLHLIRAALGRVPFEGGGLRWQDYLPPRWTRWPLLRPLRDLLSPFVPSAGLLMEYCAHGAGERVVVVGHSARRRGGAPLVQTRAQLSRTFGLALVEVRVAGQRALRAERVGLGLTSDDDASDPRVVPDRTAILPAAVVLAAAATSLDLHAGEST